MDIRELIHVQDTMEDEDLHFGPNGGLIFCIEYLIENSDWLQNALGAYLVDTVESIFSLSSLYFNCR